MPLLVKSAIESHLRVVQKFQLYSVFKKKQMDASYCMPGMLHVRDIMLVVICSDDTDVFIMSLAFHDKIGASLYQKCGTKTRRTVVDIIKVAATVSMGCAGLSLACTHSLDVILSVPLQAEEKQRH